MPCDCDCLQADGKCIRIGTFLYFQNESLFVVITFTPFSRDPNMVTMLSSDWFFSPFSCPQVQRQHNTNTIHTSLSTAFNHKSCHASCITYHATSHHTRYITHHVHHMSPTTHNPPRSPSEAFIPVCPPACDVPGYSTNSRAPPLALASGLVVTLVVGVTTALGLRHC